MFLKEITLSGFKSFADRTRISLTPGVTCIVGPNGCGKSNIVDAIRWVLGEQSAKALRGGKMQDVIFEGTDKRKALALCEVSLLFTDCEDQLGTAFHEIEIKRKATREGGSDYYLNGKACRLKDIQRLFMDTGIGRVSYSFMVQGQIDQILSTNPAERRLIFEEAAGITKYKSQRQEALQKLGNVEQNLARVRDVVSEMERQMGSLKRQALKAFQYKKLRHRLVHLDLAYQSQQFLKRKGATEVLGQETQVLSKELESKQSALEALQESLNTKRSARATGAQALEHAQEAVFTLKTQRDEAQHRSHLAKTRKADLLERLNTLNAQAESLKGEIEGLVFRTQEELKHTQLQLSLVGEVDQSLKDKNTAFDELQRALQQAEQNLIDARRRRDRLEQDIRQARTELSKHEVELKTTEAQSGHGEEALKVLELELIQAKERLENIIHRETEVQAKRLSIEESHKKAQEKVQEARQLFRQQQELLQKADRELAQQRAEVQVLEGLQAKLEGCSEAARFVLQGKLGAIWPEDSFKLLAPQLEVPEEYAAAFEAFLGVAADALLPTTDFDFQSFSQAIEGKKLGRVCVRVDSPSMSREALSFGRLQPLSELLKVADPAWEAVIRSIFKGAYLTEDLGQFLQDWKTQESFEFRYVVSLKGELVDSCGLLYLGGAVRGQGMIQRRAQIKKLEEKLKAAIEAQKNAQAQVESVKISLNEAEALLDSFGQALSQASQAKSALLGEKQACEKQLSQAEAALQKSRHVLQSLADRHKVAKQRLETANQHLTKAEEEAEAVTQSLYIHEKTVEEKRLLRDTAREDLTNARLELSEKRQRLEALQHGSSRLAQEKETLLKRLNQQEEEKKRSDEQLRQLEADLEVASLQAGKFIEALVFASEELEKKKATLSEIEERIRLEETQMGEAHHKLREVETKHLSISKKLAEEEAAFQLIIEKVQAEYELDIASIHYHEELRQANEPLEIHLDLSAFEETEINLEAIVFETIDLDALDWPSIQREVKRLRQSITQLGAVNLVAIDEYTALKERSDFLNLQMQDLVQARDEVLSAIQEINTTSQQLFEDTFKKVQANFKLTFEKLFGGGVADLELVDKEDPLESGIDIIASPPGTKLKNLTLLSGGQKTMTAVALLFSIYQVKPSPFCVLDELDAPLDDANIGRFTAILREYTAFSQFLVISHNKRTICAADTLYGVTMPERGITQLVSLQFEKEAMSPAMASVS